MSLADALGHITDIAVDKRKRKCANCNKTLNSYNLNEYCFCCGPMSRLDDFRKAEGCTNRPDIGVKHLGVTHHKNRHAGISKTKSSKWSCVVVRGNKRVNLGVFKSENKAFLALQAYDKKHGYKLYKWGGPRKKGTNGKHKSKILR